MVKHPPSLATPETRLLRDACLADVDTLAAFAIAMAWETEHKRLDPDTVRQGISRVINEPSHGRYFIAERSGEAIGTLMLTYEWSDWRCGDWWWIQSVFVAESARRTGVFQALYRHVYGLAENADRVCGLRLYVEHDNKGAQRTYTALGMQDSGYQMLEASMPWVQQIVTKE